MTLLMGLLLVVMGVIIFTNIQYQNEIVQDQIKHGGETLALAIISGMFDALAEGNNDSVVQQFERLNKMDSDIEVLIFDFNRDVTFSTKTEAVGENMGRLLYNPAAIDTLVRMTESGDTPAEPFEEKIDNRPFLSIFRPIVNEASCYHCHGSSRKVLGGIAVRTPIEKAKQAALQARNRSIGIGVTGLVFLAILIYLVFQKTVNRPVGKLQEMAQKMREGDLTHTVEVVGRDELSHMCARMNVVNDSLRNMLEEIVTTSHTLSESASQQAASLEETSASLEEMSSMTKQNADVAGQAAQIIKQADQVAHQANDSMTQVTTSMTTISSAGSRMSKIIKTIDDIAFQTNLLALNAAVEAARAGEAGAGFAVVADEVRNLAQRTAHAAKDTQQLIEETVKQVQEGSGLVENTNEAFLKVAENSKKIAELIDEIAAASSEQSQGIEQINKAVAEIDQGTQQNAASAEKLASAADAFQITNGSSSSTQEFENLNRMESLAHDLAVNRTTPLKIPTGLQQQDVFRDFGIDEENPA